MNDLRLPEGLVEIGDEAFNGWKMTSLVIPNSVTTIGNQAFDGCTELKSLVLGNSVSKIGQNAFYCNRELREIDILSEDYYYVTTYQFKSCNAVEYVNLPDTDWARKVLISLDSEYKRRYWSYETDANGKVVKLLEIATAIDAPNVTMDMKDKTIFDLKGNRLSHVKKGVNIVNGKKILVR